MRRYHPLLVGAPYRSMPPTGVNSAACIFVFGNGAIGTAITTFGASDMVLHMPHCIDLIVNQERHVMAASQECLHVMTASQECFVV
jgi:hypothetical protein